MQIYAFEIEKLKPSDLSVAFDKKNKYKPTKFSEAGRHVMEVVHGIPMLFEDVDLGELEIYIGRSFFNHSIPSQGVFQRFRWHLENRGHDYGIVVASRVIMFREGVIRCSSPARFSSGSPRSLSAARHVRTEHEQV